MFTVLICVLLTSLFCQAKQACTTPRGDQGQCMDITQCTAVIDYISTHSLTSKISSYLRRSNCGYSGDNPKICCPEKFSFEGLSGTPSSPTPKTSHAPRTSAAPTVRGEPPSVTHHRNLKLLESQCGDSNEDRVLGGSIADVSEFPWMAIIRYSSGEFNCGGSIISRRYVLTAAHCLPSRRTKPVSVRVGEHDLGTSVDCDANYCAPQHQDIAIEEIIIHEGFKTNGPTLLQNDIGLIRLATDIDFSRSNVAPICLPLDPAVRKENLTGEYMTVSGWGITEAGTKSTVLRKANLPIIPLDVCVDAFKTNIMLVESQLCGGGQAGVDSCNGDSGGPLQAAWYNAGAVKVTQFGIVSFGTRNCGTAGVPGVYTRVASFVDWILDSMMP